MVCLNSFADPAPPGPPKVKPPAFPLMTVLNEQEQTEVIKNLPNLECSRDVLEQEFKVYLNISGQPSPSALEASRSYGQCDLFKSTADAEGVGCKIHPASLRSPTNKDHCTRCDKDVRSNDGCLMQFEHKFPAPSIEQGMFSVPPPNIHVKKRALVVLDAEFVRITFKDGRTIQTVGSISVIDGLSGEVLMDKIVTPADENKVKRIEYAYSGLTPEIVNAARTKGNAVKGLVAMHKVLGRFVDSNTVFCGHALHNDLAKMKLGVDRILETQVLWYVRGEWSVGLKTLVQTRLRDSIPDFQATENHLALEDARATRELLLVKALPRQTSDSGVKDRSSEYSLQLEITLVPHSDDEPEGDELVLEDEDE